MPIRFNSILVEEGFKPDNIRLIRHKDKRSKKGFTPYELWRDDRKMFELYQSVQSISNRQKFAAPYWAVFIANLTDETMFAGLYKATYIGLLRQDIIMPHSNEVDKAGTCDEYKLELQDKFKEFIGKLFIEWGPAALAWVQHAERNNKTITKLEREFYEPQFLGLLNFICPLSKIMKIPRSWIEILKSTQGVYLLTCPKTKEQYIGSATGDEGFWGRWLNYFQTGHGGNIGLKLRTPSDYQISILEVAGSAATKSEILEMEGRWQRKLQSKEMGLNRNLAKQKE